MNQLNLIDPFGYSVEGVFQYSYWEIALLSDDMDISEQRHLTGDINEIRDGVSALHIAIGRNLPKMTKSLIKMGARVQPDAFGRWPSIIALICEAGDEVCDLVEQAENPFRYLARIARAAQLSETDKRA